MRLSMSLAALAFVASSAAATIVPRADSTALNLNSETFTSSIAEHYWLVLFYSPYCPHCRHFKPTWAELIEQEKGVSGLGFAEVNCVEQGDLCKEQGVRGFPWLQMYDNGVKTGKFDDKRTLPLLHDWIADQIAGPAAAHHADAAAEAAPIDAPPPPAHGADAHHPPPPHANDHINHLEQLEHPAAPGPMSVFLRRDFLFGMVLLGAILFYAFRRRLLGLRRLVRSSSDEEKGTAGIEATTGDGGGRGWQFVWRAKV